MIERYSRYYLMVCAPAREPNPELCDAIVSVREPTRISGWVHYQCSRKRVVGDLCRMHAKKDKK